MPIVDPVCRREIDDVEYPEQVDYKGRTYFFCSLGDFQEFLKHPDKYADESPEEEPSSHIKLE